MGSNNARRRRYRVYRGIIIFLIVLIIALLGIGVYLFLPKDAKLIEGEWKRDIDFSRKVASSIDTYLDEAEHSEIIQADNYVKNVSVSATLLLRDDGTYAETISEDDYNAAVSTANTALKMAFKDLIVYRLGISGVEKQEDVDSLIEQAIGMSLEAYLNEQGITLLPTYDELVAEYSSSGNYKYKNNIIILYDNNGVDTKEYNVFVSETALVLMNEEISNVYRR